MESITTISQPKRAESAYQSFALSQNRFGLPLRDFFYFPKLAAEIQDKIWEFASANNPAIISIHISKKVFEYVGPLPSIPAILHATSGSRGVGLKYFQVVENKIFDREVPRPIGHVAQVPQPTHQHHIINFTPGPGVLNPNGTTLPAPISPPQISGPFTNISPIGNAFSPMVPLNNHINHMNNSIGSNFIRSFPQSPGQSTSVNVTSSAQATLAHLQQVNHTNNYTCAQLQHQVQQMFTTSPLINLPNNNHLSFSGAQNLTTPVAQAQGMTGQAQVMNYAQGLMNQGLAQNIHGSPTTSRHRQSRSLGSHSSRRTSHGTPPRTPIRSVSNRTSPKSTPRSSRRSPPHLFSRSSHRSSSLPTPCRPTEPIHIVHKFYTNPTSDIFILQVDNGNEEYSYPEFHLAQNSFVLRPNQMASYQEIQTTLTQLSIRWPTVQPKPFPSVGKLPTLFKGLNHIVFKLTLPPCFEAPMSREFKDWARIGVNDYCDQFLSSAIASLPNVKFCDFIIGGEFKKDDQVSLKDLRTAPILETDGLIFGAAELTEIYFALKGWLLCKFLDNMKDGGEPIEPRIVGWVPDQVKRMTY